MKITILDPALCCSTGVCGPDTDDMLIQIAANVKWLKSKGVDISRYNVLDPLLKSRAMTETMSSGKIGKNTL